MEKIMVNMMKLQFGISSIASLTSVAAFYNQSTFYFTPLIGIKHRLLPLNIVRNFTTTSKPHHILFTHNPLTLFCASGLRLLSHFLTSFIRMFNAGEVVSVNKFMPRSTKITSYGEATAASTKRGFSVTYFSGLVKTFRRAKVKCVPDSGRRCCKHLTAIITNNFNRDLPSFVLARGGAI